MEELISKSQNNISQLNNEDISSVNINDFIKNDIYQKIYIIINMNKGLCKNRKYCYLKFEFYNNSKGITNTFYVKYDNEVGLINKKLYVFDFINEDDKNLLTNGYIKLTAYQLFDCIDENPYTFAKFRFSDMYSTINGLSLYKILNITDIYDFYFDDINIYPYSSIGNIYKVDEYFNDKLIINNIGTLINSNDKDITYTYSLSYSNINDNIFGLKSISIKIDEDDVWYQNNNFYCNILFYLKDGSKYLIPDMLFNKFRSYLHLNKEVKIDEEKFNLNNIIKFSITYFCGETNNKRTNLSHIKFSKQGNIYNEI